jgi:F-type H+-transporting ATPase subunit gamma
MPSSREMRLRIRSVKNIAQVTRAQETVSASKVRRAMQAALATRAYSEKAWQLLVHLASQPGATVLHPLLAKRGKIDKTLVLMISSDRGLAGAYNVNIVRETLLHFRDSAASVSYIAVGKKGRDMLFRRRMDVIAEFSNLPSPPTFVDVSAIGHLAVDDYLEGKVDEVYLAFTEFKNMVRQVPTIRKLLPLEFPPETGDQPVAPKTNAVYSYEPDTRELLNEIVPRFTALQVFQAILSSQASEHAARMIAMRNATDNAKELVTGMQLEYNKIRQQTITSEMLDIVGGAEAQNAA